MKRIELLPLLLIAWALVFCNSLARGEEKTPDHVYASAIVLNGDIQCSATVISKGPKRGLAVSCTHCVHGWIGRQCYLGFADGSTSLVTLLAYDDAKDLALFSVPSEAIITIAPLPATPPTSAKYDMCGYPAGKGPTLVTGLHPAEKPVIDEMCDGRTCRKRVRWQFQFREGDVYGGNSGCGIFANGQTYAVVSHKGDGTNGKKVLACPLHDLKAFLIKHAPSDAGEWQAKAAEPMAAQTLQAPAPEWRPSPNVPIQPRGTPALPPPQVQEPGWDGKGRIPSDVDTPRKRSHRIKLLEAELAELRLREMQHPPELPPSEPPQPDAKTEERPSVMPFAFAVAAAGLGGAGMRYRREQKRKQS